MSLSSNFPTIKPSLNLDFANTKRLDPRVTFTRSTTGTYYDGVTTAMAEQNLALQSQAFGTSPWGVFNGSISYDATTAPDGTSTADLMYPSGASVVTSASQGAVTSTSDTTTISVYAKANGINNIWIISGNNSSAAVWFNVSAGTVGTTAGGYTASIVSVGSGWYRCIVTGSFNALQVGISTSDGGYISSASGTNGVYLWGCQVEVRSAATAYTATTSQTITNYIPVLLTAAANVPRFDHNPTTDESLGLLIEEQRTNLLSYSSDFANGYWDKYNISLTSNTIIAPDGTLTGEKIAADASSISHYLYPASGVAVSAGTYTASIYAKAGERTRLLAAIWNGSNYEIAQFDLSNGTIVQEAVAGIASITSVGNGWYRCSVKRTIGSVTTYFSFGPYINGTLGDLTGFPTYTGDGFNGIYIWGAQLEAGSFATSYIATTAASATRNADAASMTGANFTSWFNAGEGTFYGEANLSGGGRYFHAVKTGASDQIEGVQQTTYFEAFVYSTSIQAQINIAVASFINRRVALAYQVNDIAACVSGGTVSVDTNAILPLDLNAFYVNSYGTSGPLGSGTVKKVAYYPARLTNAQLQAITS